MVDKDLILAKAGSVKRHIDRIKAKSTKIECGYIGQLVEWQEIVIVRKGWPQSANMAIQNCMDIAAHIISDEGLGVLPVDAGEMIFFATGKWLLSADLR